MKKTILLLFSCLSLACSAQWKEKDTTYHSGINPYKEIKKGEIIQAIGLLGLGATIYQNIQSPATTLEGKTLTNVAYGVSGLMILVGTIYKIQGLNYLYKPNQSGQWSFNPTPLGASIAMRF